jgi:hypothetical protein
MIKYTGRYKGLVIQNDDPEQSGRIKTFVPEVNAALLEGFTKNRDQDKKFTGLGDNLDSSLTPELIQRLKDCLPWNIIKYPIFGMGSSLTYHNDRNFSESKNDSDTAKQHTDINKTLPETDNTTTLLDALKADSSVSPDVQSTYTPTLPDYVRNSTATTSNPISAVPVSTDVKSDNIVGVTISYVDPKFVGINNRTRLFNSSFSITDSTGSVTGFIDESGTKQVNTYSSTSNIPLVILPPITYDLPTNKTVTSKTPIEISFVPITTGVIKPRKFTTRAELVVYKDGKIVSKDIYTTDSTGATVRKDTHISIDSSDIKNIVITPVDASSPIDFNSTRLGGLSSLFAEYTAVPTQIMGNPIIPPQIISQPTYNAGGSGAEMNTLSYSNILPFNAIKKSIFGGSNPMSIFRQTQKTEPDSQTDPKKTKNPNTQIPDKNPQELRSSTQGDKVKGMLSIPAVGSHVSVYFENGDPLFPVVDGVFYNQEDFMGIHDVQES